MSELPVARVVRGGDDDSGAGDAAPPPAPVLRLAPRAVPRALAWRLCFGGMVGFIGWFFAALGVVFCTVFLPKAELWTPDYDRRATATITDVEPTGSSVNDRPLYRVHYTFVDDVGVSRAGASYTTDVTAAGQREVEYVAGSPGESRLVGTRSKPFPPIVVLVLIFPVIGLGIAGWHLRGGLRSLRLLRRGVPTRGRLVDTRKTNVRVNGAPVIAMTFEYEVDGRAHRAEIKTLTPHVLQDDAEEAMVYDPLDPSRATTLDHLPGAPTIGADGELRARPGFAAHVLILPVATGAALLVAAARLVG